MVGLYLQVFTSFFLMLDVCSLSKVEMVLFHHRVDLTKL